MYPEFQAVRAFALLHLVMYRGLLKAQLQVGPPAIHFRIFVAHLPDGWVLIQMQALVQEGVAKLQHPQEC